VEEADDVEEWDNSTTPMNISMITTSNILTEVRNTTEMMLKMARDQMRHLKPKAIHSLKHLRSLEAQVVQERAHLKEMKQLFVTTVEGLREELHNQQDILDGHMLSAGTRNVTELRIRAKLLEYKVKQMYDLEMVIHSWDMGDKVQLPTGGHGSVRCRHDRIYVRNDRHKVARTANYTG